MVAQKVRLDCGECDGPSVGGSVRCCATRRWRREEADTCSETHHPRHVPPSLGRITLHTNIIDIIHIDHTSREMYGAHRAKVSSYQEDHFLLTPTSPRIMYYQSQMIPKNFKAMSSRYITIALAPCVTLNNILLPCLINLM